MTIKIEFTQDQIDQLFTERFTHPHPRVQRRLEAVYLKSQGMAHKEICALLRISKVSLSEWLQNYAQRGIEALKEIHFKGRKGALEEYKGTLEEHFRKHPPTTIQEACRTIKELTGVERRRTAVRHFLLSLGMSVRKTGIVPGKANREVQEEFKKKVLEPKLQEAKEGVREVWFVDAAHFVWMGIIRSLWCFTRVWFSSPSGRQRFNILAGINAVTHEVVTVCNDSYINSWSVVEFLFKMRERFRRTRVPITLVLDNARYQKCYLVQWVAALAGIELLYLPPYSPNLNLIERLWKFIRGKCLGAHEYKSFVDFSAALKSCVENAHKNYPEELASLMSWNFQQLPEVHKEVA